MGSYNDEYKRYYQNINGNYVDRYKKNDIHKNKIDKKRELINYTILQAAITMIMMITIICMKYSRDASMIKRYTTFTKAINKKSSYVEIINNIKNTDFKNIYNDVKECIDEIVDKADIKL